MFSISRGDPRSDFVRNFVRSSGVTSELLEQFYVFLFNFLRAAKCCNQRVCLSVCLSLRSHSVYQKIT